jgi:catechol 2,3-dioxygenase-like lactoylglutathione lyase family enzyme
MRAGADNLALTFDHVAQQVPDVAAAVAWYLRTVPGARVLHQDATWAFVDAVGTRLAFIQQGDHPDHIGWRVSEEDLERLAAAHGRSIRTHRDKTRSFYIEAPGGRWIEFIAYPADSTYQP